ncbi:thermonuclease family protein [Chloroflexota bacterium]
MSTDEPAPNAPPQITIETADQTVSPSQLTEAKVVRVIDGDTIEVDIGGKPYKVRYIGIDTPEVGQPGADKATYFNAQLVSGKTVYLEKDVSETDRYGRLLRYVWLEEAMVNAIMVTNGYAQVSTYPPDVKYQQDFLELQRQAEESGLGLWAVPQPTPTTEGMFVGSVNSDVYHYPTCAYAQRIYPENLIWFNSSDDARARGYSPCEVCRPP